MAKTISIVICLVTALTGQLFLAEEHLLQTSDGDLNHFVNLGKNDSKHPTAETIYEERGIASDIVSYFSPTPMYNGCPVDHDGTKGLSPINIDVHLSNLIHEDAKLKLSNYDVYKVRSIDVRHDGDTVHINFQYSLTPGAVKPYMQESNKGIGDGLVFKLIDIRIHCPARHTITGKHFALEVEFIHKRQQQGKDGWSMVSVLFQEGSKDNDELRGLLSLVKKLEQPETKVGTIHASIDLLGLLKSDKPMSYFSYIGSMMSPPCAENMDRYVLQPPNSISSNQMAIFRHLKLHPEHVKWATPPTRTHGVYDHFGYPKKPQHS